MSGIEVAGIVLAVIPLFVEGADGAKRFYRGFFNMEEILDDFKDELGTQESLLILYMKKVLGATKLPASTQRALMNDPGGDGWYEAHVKRQIEARLGDASKPFFGILDRIANTLLKSLEKDHTLRLGNSNDVTKLQNIRSGGMTGLSVRLKFSWRQPRHNRILFKMEKYNNELRALIGAAEGAEPYQKYQSCRKVHFGFQLSEYVRQLHRVFSSTCTCTDRTPHDMHLRMRVCDESEENPKACFDILLIQQQIKSCEITVRMARDSSSSRVTIQAPGDKVDAEPGPTLEDICHPTLAASNSQTRLEWEIDREKKLRIISSAPKAAQASSRLLTLDKCLSSFPQFAANRRFLRERYIFAVHLAHSIVQFRTTPWLGTQWSAQDISFSYSPEQMNPDSDRFGSFYRTPYVNTSLGSLQTDSASSQRADQKRLLLCLAILLLELHMNCSLQLDLTSGYDVRGSLMDQLQSCYTDSGMNEDYRDAISWCISPKPDPHTRVIDFDEGGFRELYFSQVMLRLENVLKDEFDIDLSSL